METSASFEARLAPSPYPVVAIAIDVVGLQEPIAIAIPMPIPTSLIHSDCFGKAVKNRTFQHCASRINQLSILSRVVRSKILNDPDVALHFHFGVSGIRRQ